MSDSDRDYGDRGFDRNKGRKRRPKRMNFRRKRPPADLSFDYKNVYTLTNFLTEEGKIIPGRVSGLSAHQQRELTLAVKRARNLAFLSAVSKNSIR